MTVCNKNIVHLKNRDRMIIAGNVHYHAGKISWYLYPRLGESENYGAQPLCVRLVENEDRPIKHMDRIYIETRELSQHGNALGTFLYGVYYYENDYKCQEWILIRKKGEGELSYGDEFNLQNFHDKSYLKEYYVTKWSMYYLTTTKKIETATDWYFVQTSIGKDKKI